MNMNVNAAYRRSLVGPLILIGIGVLFLLHNLVGFDLFRIIRNYWPIILIVIGLAKLAEYYRVSRQIPK
jgi:hypothetical protein